MAGFEVTRLILAVRSLRVATANDVRGGEGLADAEGRSGGPVSALELRVAVARQNRLPT